MPSSDLPTRRTFVQALSSVAAFTGLTSALPATLAATTSLIPQASKRCFAFVASRDNAISVFSVAKDGAWELVQTLASSSPVSLVLSRDQRFLYAANAVDSFNDLPAGSVEAYAIDGLTGHISLINRRALALFATRPTSLAVSPQGQFLAAATAGGVYNLLPLNEDGSVGRVTASIKPIVSVIGSVKPGYASQPTVHFNAKGVLFVTGAGNNRFSSSLVTDDGTLSPKHHAAPENASVSHLASHPGGDGIFVASVLEPLIASFKDEREPSSALKLPTTTGITALAIHPSGLLLFALTIQGIYIVRVTRSGDLELAGYYRKSLVWPAVFTITPDGAYLFALNHRDSFVRFDVDVGRAQLNCPVHVAALAAPVALTITQSQDPPDLNIRQTRSRTETT